MIKLRISSENPREVEDVISLLESLFPDMRFTAARMGSNPKYADDQKYFSYGEPRVRNKKPIPINFKLIGRKLLNTPAPTPAVKPVAKPAIKPAEKQVVYAWQRVLGLDGVPRLSWAKCRRRYRDLTADEISQAKKNLYVDAMDEAAKHFNISL